MKRYIVFPLIIASLSLTLELQHTTQVETVIHAPKDTDQENTLTIYKDPAFISKWNGQFVELEGETTEKKD
jgi:hypothetical protein